VGDAAEPVIAPQRRHEQQIAGLGQLEIWYENVYLGPFVRLLRVTGV